MKNFLGIIAGLAAFWAVQYFFFSDSTSSNVSQTEVRELIHRNDTDGLFQLIESEFPAEFDTYMIEMTAIVNDRSIPLDEVEMVVFQHSSNFTSGLRMENAAVIANAGMLELAAIQRQNLLILESFQSNPEMCAEFGLRGLASFGPDDLSAHQLDLVSKSALLTFEAIASGRRNQIPNEEATDEDFFGFLTEWSISAGVDAEMFRVLIEEDTASPIYCKSLVSFQSFLVNSRSALRDRVLTSLTIQVMGI